jgi:hypothetical protein
MRPRGGSNAHQKHSHLSSTQIAGSKPTHTPPLSQILRQQQQQHKQKAGLVADTRPLPCKCAGGKWGLRAASCSASRHTRRLQHKSLLEAVQERTHSVLLAAGALVPFGKRTRETGCAYRRDGQSPNLPHMCTYQQATAGRTKQVPCQHVPLAPAGHSRRLGGVAKVQ